MKPTLTLLDALPPAPLAALAQAKPEVATDTSDEEATAARVKPQAALDQLHPAGSTTADDKPKNANRKLRKTTSP
jgi:hypothetical protein